MTTFNHNNSMSSFGERFFHYLQVTDPRTLLTPNSKIMECQKILSNCKANALQCGTPQDMAAFKRIVDACVHPATGEIIPAPFRVSAIAPVNIPIVFLMLTTPSTNIAGTLFLHWVNQSYNTACNYFNRSGNSQPLEDIAKAYCLATLSACSLAFGLGKAVERAPPSVKRFGMIIPCLATAAANCSNLVLTRMGELTEGTAVRDEDGAAVGSSKKAGLVCVAQTASTRCVLVPAACLLLPGAVMGALKAVRLSPSSPRLLLALELAVIFASLQAALPAALAVFPQSAQFSPSQLEPEFRGLKRKDGSPVLVLTANKGL